jgi:hypothetical protein
MNPLTDDKVDCALLKVLADDFEQYGAAAIAAMREIDPSGYIRAIVSSIPKETQVKSPLAGLSHDELAASVAVVLAFVRSQGLH